MKTIAIIFLLCLSTAAISQRLDEYVAANGLTYHEGDTVLFGKGSGPSGSFVYAIIGGWAMPDPNGQTFAGIGAMHADMAVVIKRIKTMKMKGQSKVWFVVGGGNITNYYLMIDQAIAVCEVIPCNDFSTPVSASDKYDDLKKIKELLDSGVITQEEFDEEKAKILN